MLQTCHNLHVTWCAPSHSQDWKKSAPKVLCLSITALFSHPKVHPLSEVIVGEQCFLLFLPSLRAGNFAIGGFRKFQNLPHKSRSEDQFQSVDAHNIENTIINVALPLFATKRINPFFVSCLFCHFCQFCGRHTQFFLLQ